MYSTFIFPIFFEFFTIEKIGITEHSVFPEPVGAITKQSFFCNIEGDAFFCISVRLEKPKLLNKELRFKLGVCFFNGFRL